MLVPTGSRSGTAAPGEWTGGSLLPGPVVPVLLPVVPLAWQKLAYVQELVHRIVCLALEECGLAWVRCNVTGNGTSYQVCKISKIKKPNLVRFP